MKVLRVIGATWALVIASFGVYQLARIADNIDVRSVGLAEASAPVLPVEWNESGFGSGQDTEALKMIASAIRTIYVDAPDPNRGLQAIADAIRSLD